MVSSSKRARRRRLAQRETSHSDHQMDPANLSGPDSDLEEGEDHEILFPPRAQDIVITPSSPGKVQADWEPFPSDAVQNVAPTHRVRRAVHYMAAMGLWRPPSTQGFRAPAVVVM